MKKTIFLYVLVLSFVLFTAFHVSGSNPPYIPLLFIIMTIIGSLYLQMIYLNINTDV